MKKPTDAPLKLETIAKQLNAEQKSEFFDVFWRTWSANGFGTLTKKDSELLIFGCLKRAFGSTGPGSNYGWARLLRLTPSRIKSMRLESYLRFGHLFGESDLSDTERFFKDFTVLQSVDIRGLNTSGDLNEVTLSFAVEDPVVQMVIENDLKSIGSYLDFHRNREIVRLKLIDFLKLVASTVEREVIDRWVAERAKENAAAGALKTRVLAKEYSNKTEAGKLLTFADDLAKFAKVDVLTDHLKRIFKSQSERK